MSKWLVLDAADRNTCLAVVTFNQNVNGDTGFVSILAKNDQYKNVVLLYLEDPFNQRPVYIEGLGAQKGPHSLNIEQFDSAMSTLSHYFPGYVTQPGW